MRLGIICDKHGYIRGHYCPHCAHAPAKKSSTGVITHDWIKSGAWSDIDPQNPNLRVDSKEELFRHCERTGNYAKAFMKPRSQGKGWEHRKRLI